MFSRGGHPKQIGVEGLAMGGDRSSFASIHRIKNVKEETVGRWRERAANQVKQFEEDGVRNCTLSRVQLEALWTSVGQKGEKGGTMRRRKEARSGKDWQYLQVITTCKKGQIVSVRIRVAYGDPEEGKATVGTHRAYVERTNLTSRQMNGQIVRKTLSFSKELRFLEAVSGWEDTMYNFTRPLKTLRVKQEEHRGSTRWRQRTPAMAAGLTAHVWTVQELLTAVLVPSFITT